jgi:hypothetical protein
MSHHYSGPDFGFPRGDARLDFTDLFAFPNPRERGRSILIVNVHPSSTIDPGKPTTTQPFSTDAQYELKIDRDGDGVADVAYRVRVSSEAGGQMATLRRLEGGRAAGAGDDGEVIVERVPVCTGREVRVGEGRDHRLFAGWRSDPFFFDVLGAANNLQFTGRDFFADKDVCSIVLDVPDSALGTGRVGLWARVLARADGNDTRWVQVERGARPQQAVFLAGAARDAYQSAEPADDARFVPVFAHALEHAGGYSSEEAKRVAEKLLPDIMPYDPRQPASFPNNGRRLTDDVTAVFLPILTNGKVKKSGAMAHRDLLDDFPYVGPPHRG